MVHVRHTQLQLKERPINVDARPFLSMITFRRSLDPVWILYSCTKPSIWRHVPIRRIRRQGYETALLSHKSYSRPILLTAIEKVNTIDERRSKIIYRNRVFDCHL